ncbi:MAG: hypothetical protein FWE47_02745 [Oscillospiraceae bacterium]|nr:hypothetical protein [Oscillospiraceae bacterium]
MEEKRDWNEWLENQMANKPSVDEMRRTMNIARDRRFEMLRQPIGKLSMGEKIADRYINWVTSLDETAAFRNMLVPFSNDIINWKNGKIKVRIDAAEQRFTDSIVQMAESFDNIREDNWIEKMGRFMETIDKEKMPGLHTRFKLMKEAVGKIPEQKGDMVKLAQAEPYRFYDLYKEQNKMKDLFCEMAQPHLGNWNDVSLDRPIENALKGIRAERVANEEIGITRRISVKEIAGGSVSLPKL